MGHLPRPLKTSSHNKMPTTNSMERRPWIGAAAAILLVAGALTMFFPGIAGTSNGAIAAACVRSGSVMFALWLAYPDLHRIPSWMWTGLVIAAAVFAIRPRAALVVVPMLITIWMVMPKKPRSRPS